MIPNPFSNDVEETAFFLWQRAEFSLPSKPSLLCRPAGKNGEVSFHIDFLNETPQFDGVLGQEEGFEIETRTRIHEL
jgi:hypothetical protein